MVSLYRGRFVAVHLYSTFSVDPKNFSLWAHLYQKITIFHYFGAESPYCLSHNGEVWHEGADLGHNPTGQIL